MRFHDRFIMIFHVVVGKTERFNPSQRSSFLKNIYNLHQRKRNSNCKFLRSPTERGIGATHWLWPRRLFFQRCSAGFWEFRMGIPKTARKWVFVGQVQHNLRVVSQELCTCKRCPKYIPIQNGSILCNDVGYQKTKMSVPSAFCFTLSKGLLKARKLYNPCDAALQFRAKSERLDRLVGVNLPVIYGCTRQAHPWTAVNVSPLLHRSRIAALLKSYTYIILYILNRATQPMIKSVAISNLFPRKNHRSSNLWQV